MKTVYKNALVLILLLLPSKSYEKLKSFQNTHSFLQKEKDEKQKDQKKEQKKEQQKEQQKQQQQKQQQQQQQQQKQQQQQQLTDIQKEQKIIQEIKDVTYIQYATGKCDLSNCDNCVTNNICQCPYGYAHDPKKEIKPNVKTCQYKLKKQTIFFLLEMLLPFGVGHLYAKRILYGLLKMLGAILIVSTDIIVKKILKSFDSKQTFNICVYSVYFAYFAWILIDLICISINYFKDGNGFDIMTMREDL